MINLHFFLSDHSEIMICIEKVYKTSNLIRLRRNTNFVPRYSSFIYYILNPSGKVLHQITGFS